MIGKTVTGSVNPLIPTPATASAISQRRRLRGEVVRYVKATGELILQWRETDGCWTQRTYIVSEGTEITCALLVRNDNGLPRLITRRLDDLQPGQEVIVDYQTVGGHNLALVICYRK
jgi:hypothetical protein